MKKIIIIALCIGLGWYIGAGRKKTPAIKNTANTGGTIVAFGDSLTYGQGARREQSYPAVLSKLLGREVINLGKNGETATTAPVRLSAVLEYRPYMVLIEFGGNDFMRSVPFEETVRAVEQMVLEVQRSGAVAVIVDTGGYGPMSRYSSAYKQIAREHGALFVPGILDGIFGRRALMSDQIHPNAQGYEQVAQKVYKVIAPYTE